MPTKTVKSRSQPKSSQAGTSSSEKKRALSMKGAATGKTKLQFTFKHARDEYNSYRELSREFRGRRPIQPPPEAFGTFLSTFPETFKSPLHVIEDCRNITTHPFLFMQDIVYRPNRAQALALFRREGFDPKRLKDYFPGIASGDTVEFFWENSVTGKIHYIGQFLFVHSKPFSYTHAHCGSLKKALFPKDFDKPEPLCVPSHESRWIFYVFQYMGFNRKLYPAFAPMNV